MRRPRVAPVPTIPDLQLTADRALSLHRPTRWQAQGQLCACRSLSLSLLPEVTSLDLHATEIAADRAMHPSTGSGQALRQAQGRPFGRLRAGLHRLAGSRPQLCVSPTALCLSRPDPALNLATTRPTVGFTCRRDKQDSTAYNHEIYANRRRIPTPKAVRCKRC